MVKIAGTISVGLLAGLSLAPIGTAQMERPAPAEALQVDLPDEGVVVPMLHQLHLPALEVMINGEGPFKMGFDSGASGYISFNQDVVDRLGLEKVDTITASDGAGRNAREVDVYGVATLQIGDAVFHDLDGHVGAYNRGPLAQNPIDGIIGIGLFSGLTLTLDYPNETISVSREALGAPDGATILALHNNEPVPTIDLTIGANTIRAHLDARNMGGLNAPSSIIENHTLLGEPVNIGVARTQFNEIPIQAAQFGGDVALGRYTLHQPAIVFADVFRTANVGSRIMQEFEVTFDMANFRVRFLRHGDEPIAVPMPQPRPAPQN